MPRRATTVFAVFAILAVATAGCSSEVRLRSAQDHPPAFISVSSTEGSPLPALSATDFNFNFNFNEAQDDSGTFEGGGPRPTDLVVSGFWVPAFKVNPDEDEREPSQGIEFDADLDTGQGWAARVGFSGDETKSGLGLLYMTTRHRESVTRRHARTHSGYLELLLRTPESRGPLDANFAVGIGVGGAAFDFDGGFDDSGGAAVMIRGEMGLTLFRQFDLTVGGGGFLWGYPTETIGYGGFFTIGGTVHF